MPGQQVQLQLLGILHMMAVLKLLPGEYAGAQHKTLIYQEIRQMKEQVMVNL